MQYKYFQENPAKSKKDFYSWFFKYSNVFLVILVILIVPLYIIFFGEYINEKIKNILTACAAIFSSCFLFLAFRESRKGNELKTQEHFYTILEKQVTEVESIAKNKVFSSASGVVYPEFYELNLIKSNLEKIKYNFFIYPLRDALKTIEINDHYRRCIKLIGTEKSKPLDEQTKGDLKHITDTLVYIQKYISKIFMYYSDVWQLYDRIDTFTINIELKKLLIARLNATINEYFLLYDVAKEFAEMNKYISDFAFFEITNATLVSEKCSLHVDVKVFINNINTIKEKYKDDRIQFDPFKAYKPEF
jgi:hypothetical protein